MNSGISAMVYEIHLVIVSLSANVVIHWHYLFHPQTSPQVSTLKHSTKYYGRMQEMQAERNKEEDDLEGNWEVLVSVP